MKKLLNMISILVIGFIVTNLIIAPTTAQLQGPNYEVEDHCSNATEFINITNDAFDYKFDKKELRVSKTTCVQLTMINLNPLVEHDITVDNVPGELDQIYIYTVNNTDGPNKDGVKTFNFTTPDLDKSYSFYCSMQSHKAAGMFGLLIVGEGSSESDILGFGLPITISTFMMLLVIIPKFRKPLENN